MAYEPKKRGVIAPDYRKANYRRTCKDSQQPTTKVGMHLCMEVFFFLEGVSRFQTTSLVLANLSQALRVWEHLPQIKIKEEKGGTFPWASYNNGIKCRSKKMTSLEGQESQTLLGHGISIPYP